MLKKATQRSFIRSSLGVFALVLTAVASSVQALETPSLRGMWVGSSVLEGRRDAVKTTLSFGDADGTTLRIEEGRVCTLKLGTYAEQGSDTWSLSFKEVHGGDACKRLAKGNFSLRAGGPRKLEFDVSYPAPDGSTNHRRGVLSRYP